jgi:hypothetical protein
MRRAFLLTSLILGLVAFGTAFAPVAGADTTGPITFEPPAYQLGDINGQNSWMKTGPYDVEVASVTRLPSFGTQALRLSNSVTSGSFGDQTFSPAVLPAGKSPALPHFEATFDIGTTLTTYQSGLSMSVSPDNGSGARMSYLRFDDQANGVHVFFDDFRGNNFFEKDIATLNRATAHTIKFSINFKAGPGNDVATISIDTVKLIAGKTWEGYYERGGESVPTVSKMLLREGGTAVQANDGNGYLVDNLTLSSSTP